MDELNRKATAVFSRPFNVPGFDEEIPAGEYEIEMELAPPPDHLHPESWKASVLVKLHLPTSHPGLARTLAVSLTTLEETHARDKLTGTELTHYLLEELLADPMMRLVMEADGVSEIQLRHLYSGSSRSAVAADIPQPNGSNKTPRDNVSIHAAENEGMPTYAE